MVVTTSNYVLTILTTGDDSRSEKSMGKPDVGNPQVRFEEGGGGSLVLPLPYSTNTVGDMGEIMDEGVVHTRS